MTKHLLALAVALALVSALAVATSGDSAPRRRAPSAHTVSPPSRVLDSGERPRTAPRAGVPVPVESVSHAEPLAAASAPVVSAAPRRLDKTIETTIAEDVAKVAAKLGLDAETQGKIAELTRQTFLDAMEELRREPRDSAATDALLARRSDELHTRVLELLPPSARAGYRDLIGR